MHDSLIDLISKCNMYYIGPTVLYLWTIIYALYVVYCRVIGCAVVQRLVLGLCNYHSCQNDGGCFDFEEDFLCHCNLEYEGKSCETGNSSL